MSPASRTDTPGFRFGALGVGHAVEEQFGRAVGRHHRDAVAFQNAEVGDIAQIIALPGIAVGDDRIDPGRRHGIEQASAPLVGKGGWDGMHALLDVPHQARFSRSIEGGAPCALPLIGGRGHCASPGSMPKV